MYNIINTSNAPQPIGPYSQGIQVNNFVILSGQIPINLDSQIVSNEISQQTIQVLNNIKNILQKSQLKIKNIIKVNMFVTDLHDIHIINSIYEKFFIENKANLPARTCVEVKSLPKNSKIEIDVMAITN